MSVRGLFETHLTVADHALRHKYGRKDAKLIEHVREGGLEDVLGTRQPVSISLAAREQIVAILVVALIGRYRALVRIQASPQHPRRWRREP
jgi:hypothetical protein